MNENISNFSKINLLVSIDKNYLSVLATMLSTYSKHHKNIKTDVYVMHSSLDENDFDYLESSLSNESIKIKGIKITDKYFSDIPILERIPEESFYRLLAFYYLGEDVERCLYLDPDICIRKNLSSLYGTDMKDNYVLAASHAHGLGNLFHKLRLGCSEEEKYFNSGVMLMNLSSIRRDFTKSAIISCLKENAQKLIMGDQDMANILFGQKTLLVDETVYNIDEKTFQHLKKKKGIDLDFVRDNTAIIHYDGKYKPWLKGYKGELNGLYPESNEYGEAPNGLLKKQIKSIWQIIRPRGKQIVSFSGTLIFLASLIFSYAFFGKELTAIISQPELLRAWLDGFGVFDELIFILIRAAQTVVKFIPAEPLEIGSGYAWGTIQGMLYCLTGNMIGTVIILSLVKHFGKRIIDKFVSSKNFKSLKIFENSERLYALIFLFYLIPGSPKDGFTYLVGILPVKPLPYMLITAIARIPSILSSTLCGSTFAEKNYLLSAVILVFTILLGVLGGVLYKKIFMNKSQNNEEKTVCS